MNKSAIICAAGMGTRLGLNNPKILTKISGVTLLDRQLEALTNYDVTIVCGYQKDKVIKAVDGRAKIIINDDYKNTNVCHSISLCPGDDSLILDGDLLFTKKAVDALPNDNFIGICGPRSEQPVYIELMHDQVKSFTKRKTDYEWACIFRGSPRWFDGFRNEYVYQILSNKLPLTAAEFISFEIDTKNDLKLAEQWWYKQSTIDEFWTNRPLNSFLWNSEYTKYDIELLDKLIPPGMDILDLGAGNGRLSKHIAAQARSVTAVDYMPVVLTIEDTKIQTIQSDIRSFRNDKLYDIIILFGVVTCINIHEISPLYNKCASMLKPKGMLIVKHQCGIKEDINVDTIFDGQHYCATYPHWTNELDRLRNAGFAVSVIDPYPKEMHKHNNTFFRMFVCKT